MKQNKCIKMLPTSMTQILREVGQRIQIARKRRDYTQERLAELAKTSRDTIRRIEAGDPAVAWGIIAHVLWALQLEREFKTFANPNNDKHGIALDRRNLPQRVRPSIEEEDKYDF